MRQPRYFSWLLLLTLVASVSAQPAETDDEDFFALSLEDLAELEVVSASRQGQKIGDLSAAVTVVTAEDIHYSGLTNIPEILQFALGTDVVRLDRNRYAVGVRGLHDFMSDRTLTLINGRIADSPLFGGSDFSRLPVLLEDIERIEILRGPGGAAWGANAFTGVINIITKAPEDALGTLATATVSEYGDLYSHLRWGDEKGKWGWRISAGYEDKKSSDEVNSGKYSSTGNPTLNALIGFDNYTAKDFSQDLRFDTEATHAFSEQTQLRFGAGYAKNTQGSFEFGGYFPQDDVEYEMARPFVKLDHEFTGGDNGYLQWFGNFEDSWGPSISEWRSSENDLEAQYNFQPWAHHALALGGNLRAIRINTTSHSDQDIVFNNEPYDEYLTGVFLMDRWSISDRLTLDSQVRGDWYSETQADWSGRISTLYALDEEKDHTLRLSWAKAFRAPLASLRESSTERVALPIPGLYAFNVLHPDNALENEETQALEMGYTGRLADSLTLRADIYYQRFKNMIGYRNLPDPLSLGRAFYQADNIDGANSYGMELEIARTTEKSKISTWYALNRFDSDQVDQNLRSYAPAPHKVGVTLRRFFAGGWTANANYRYTSETEGLASTLENVEASNRLDLTLGKTFAQGAGELMVGVADVLKESDGPNYTMGSITAHETPGRMFFGRVLMHF